MTNIYKIKDAFVEIVCNSKHGLHKIFIDINDYSKIKKYKWRILKGRHTFYAITTLNKSPVRMHRLILNVKDRKVFVDHVDNNGLNNKKSNLRTCTDQQNKYNANKHALCSSSLKGVSWYKRDKKWSASITINGKKKHLGLFDSEIEAAKAYNETAVKLFGEFANTNKL